MGGLLAAGFAAVAPDLVGGTRARQAAIARVERERLAPALEAFADEVADPTWIRP